MVNVIVGRDARILEAAVSLARTQGYQWITRDAVAMAADVAPATINNAFGSVVGLKRAVLRHAIEHEILEIVAQGLADKHEIAHAAPEDLKKRALASLTAA